MNIITRTGKVQCGPLTKLVVTVKGNAWLLSSLRWFCGSLVRRHPCRSILLRWVSAGAVSCSDRRPPRACWIKCEGNGKSPQEKVCSLGQEDPQQMNLLRSSSRLSVTRLSRIRPMPIREFLKVFGPPPQ